MTVAGYCHSVRQDEESKTESNSQQIPLYLDKTLHSTRLKDDFPVISWYVLVLIKCIRKLGGLSMCKEAFYFYTVNVMYHCF